VARVDVHHGEGQRRRPECLLCDSKEDDGVLAAGKEERWAFKLGGDLSHDEDGFRLEHFEDGIVLDRDEGFLGGHRAASATGTRSRASRKSMIRATHASRVSWPVGRSSSGFAGGS
jgi:hypothetical protein